MRVTHVTYTLMSALQWAADYPTCQMLSCIGTESSHWLMNRFYYPSAKDRETRVREVQAPAQGHTAQKHQAESPTPLCLMLQLDQPKLPSLASWKEEQGEECLWGVAISCIRILKTKVKQKKKKKIFFWALTSPFLSLQQCSSACPLTCSFLVFFLNFFLFAFN